MPDFLAKKQNFFNQYAVYLIILLAFVLRVWHLGKRDFWYDEAFVGVIVRYNWAELLQAVAGDTHPPLYFLGLKLFATLLGSTSVVVLRLFSVMWGIGSVYLTYRIAKELASVRAGLWGALLAAIAPFAVQYSQEARMYAMVAFLCLLAAYFFVRAVKTGNRGQFVLWGLCMGLSWLTHTLTIVFSALFLVAFCIWQWSQENRGGLKNGLKIIFSPKVWLGYVVGLVVFLPWLPSFIRQFTAVSDRISWIAPVTWSDFFGTLYIFFVGHPLGQQGMLDPNPNLLLTPVVGITASIVILLVASFRLARARKRDVQILVLWSAGFLALVAHLSLIGKDFFVARYLIPAAFFVYVLLGLWLADMRQRYAIIFFALYLSFILLIRIPPYSEGYNLLLKEKIVDHSQSLYVLNSFDYLVAKYYFGEQAVVLYNIDWPVYNPNDWSGFSTQMRRTETEDEARGASTNRLIINRYGGQNFPERVDELLKNFVLIKKLENVEVYQPR